MWSTTVKRIDVHDMLERDRWLGWVDVEDRVAAATVTRDGGANSAKLFSITRVGMTGIGGRED